jgi:4-hydroxy-2-oxoglutarate aldolase
MTLDLSGIFPPITTPFDTEGEILYDRFRENLRRWADADLAGLLVLGSNGESPLLSDDEKLELVRVARPYVENGRLLIAGANGESTRLALDFVRKLADLGADCALIGTPTYFKTALTDDSLYAHFSRIADHSPIPILLYNVPQFTGVPLSARLVERLAAHSNIAGIKESSGNVALQGEIRRRTPERFTLLVGSAPTLLPSLIQGAAGGVVAIACALPGLTVDLYRAFRAGDWKAAAQLQAALSPPAAAVTSGYGIAGLKAALDFTGYFGGEPRLPLLPLGPRERDTVRSVLQTAAGVCASA